jgi:hypothetical protein
MKSYVLALASSLAFAVPAVADEAFGQLTVQEVAAKQKEKNVFIFDNNQEARFKKSHVPSARWLNPFNLQASDLPADKSATLIFYCANEH